MKFAMEDINAVKVTKDNFVWRPRTTLC